MHIFSRLLEGLRIVRRKTPAKRPSFTVAPRLEALEDRLVPSTMFDLTTRGASAAIGGALFRQGDAQLGGTGLASFLRLDQSRRSAVQEGFNTDARPLQFDAQGTTAVTHGLKLSAVAQVLVNGTRYREFELQVNENSSLLSRRNPLTSRS